MLSAQHRIAKYHEHTRRQHSSSTGSRSPYAQSLIRPFTTNKFLQSIRAVMMFDIDPSLETITKDQDIQEIEDSYAFLEPGTEHTRFKTEREYPGVDRISSMQNNNLNIAPHQPKAKLHYEDNDELPDLESDQTHKTKEEVESQIKKALEVHMKQDPHPEPSTPEDHDSVLTKLQLTEKDQYHAQNNEGCYRTVYLVNTSTRVPRSQRPNSVAKKTRRNIPQFIPTDYFVQRVHSYWDTITTNPQYSNMVLPKTIEYMVNKSNILPASLFLMNVIPHLLPNNINIDYFRKYQNVDDWYYKANSRRGNTTRLPMRWCGQNINFYETFVIRYKANERGKLSNREALCPYCPFDQRFESFEDIFHSTSNSSYMHHVNKNHGVYSTGYEMRPPVVLQGDGEGPIARCTDCGEKCKMYNMGSGLSNSLTIYFRHCYQQHNKKRNNRTAKQRMDDNAFFSETPGFLYEFDDEETTSTTKARFSDVNQVF